jgi:hypothetical protein
MGRCGMHDGRSTGATAISEDPARGMQMRTVPLPECAGIARPSA